MTVAPCVASLLLLALFSGCVSGFPLDDVQVAEKKPKPAKCAPPPSPPLGYVGVCSSGERTCFVSCNASLNPPWFPKSHGHPPRAKCTDHGRWVYSGCEVGCPAACAPLGYLGNCSAGLACTNVSCDLDLDFTVGLHKDGHGHHGVPAIVFCNTTTHAFQFDGCAPVCAPSIAPIGYVGNCSEGSTCANVTCDIELGYYPLNIHLQLGNYSHFGNYSHLGNHSHNNSGAFGAAVAICNATTLTFHYSGCGKLPLSGAVCVPSVAPIGYVGNCSEGPTCANVSCDMGLGYFGAAVAICNATTLTFEYSGCGTLPLRNTSGATGCNASVAPEGYLGNCPAGTVCHTPVTCNRQAGWFPVHGKPTAKCNIANSTFTYSGCAFRCCKATKAPKGYKGNCHKGCSCPGVSCDAAKGFLDDPNEGGAKATCKNGNGNGAPFHFTGCGLGCFATRPPKEYHTSAPGGICPRGFHCSVTCANKKGVGKATCKKSLEKFTFSGCKH